MSTPRESGIDQLISALTADGRPDELAGRDAALVAFRAAGQRAATEQTIRQRRISPSSRPLTGWLTTRLAAITAAAAVVIAGIAVAAYTQALPEPVQDAAHSVFAPLGVPGSQHLSASTGPSQGPAGITAATQPGGCQSCATVSKTPSPRTGERYLVTLAAARARVPAGSADVLTGRVADGGGAAAGVRVWLVERTTGSAQWTIVATGITGPRGAFRFVTPPLTESVVFRVVGPDRRAYSPPVKVTVPRTPLPAGS